MRILVISNLYPPYYKSGYELGCRDIVESLKAKGHEIRVLTSTHGVQNERTEGDVYRVLAMDLSETMVWQQAFLKELVNQTAFQKICDTFQPDNVLIFNLAYVSISLGLLATKLGLPTCYFVSNNWYAVWEKDHWYQVWPRERSGYKVLRFLSRRFELIPPSRPLDYTQIVFTNSYLKTIAGQVGKLTERSSVIPWGVDINRFSYREVNSRKPSRLLYVGQLRPHKSINTVIRALEILKHQYGYDDFSFTISRDDQSHPHYVSYLRDLADSCGVSNHVRFGGLTTYENMPDLYHAHDILVFPSMCEDAMSLSVLEAMSCGLAVVSTAIGGESEVLDSERNALIFPKEKPEECARQIMRLLKDPEFFESIRSNARQTVEQRFNLDRLAGSLEGILEEACRRSKADHHHSVSKGISLMSQRDRRELMTKRIRRAKRLLKYGGYIALSRNLIKPRFYIHMLRIIFQKTSAIAALLVFPLISEGLFLLAGRRRKSSQICARTPRKVMVTQLSDIGDIILTSPFLRELRRFLPNAWIVLVVQPSMFNLVEKCPHVDEVRLFRWRAAKNWRTAWRGHVFWWVQSTWISMRSLWGKNLDMAISLRWNNDPNLAASLILMYMSGAPQRIAYTDGPDDDKLRSTREVNHFITGGPVRGFPKHEIELQLDLLRFLGANPKETRLELWTTRDDERFARNVLTQHGLPDDDLLIAFAPGAAWAYRRWPASRFIELGRWLQDNYKAWILIVAGKSELGLASQIKQGLQGERVINLAGQTTLREMASLFKHCTLFVGNDSGPMHVAAAAGISVVGLFGPGEYERFKPWGVNHEVIHVGLLCNPCSENCKFHEPYCIKGITVNQVKKILEEKLKA